jgi:hypothetical protein
MSYKEVQQKNPKDKTFLLKFFTQPEDLTKVRNKAVHLWAQHKDDLLTPMFHHL